MKSLIADDDVTSRLLLQRFLSPYGETNFAVNGKEAIEAFRLARKEGACYDLVCLDIKMPEMDGTMVLKTIRGLEEESGIMFGDGVKVIMITSLSDKSNVLQSFKNACDAYLIKPIDGKKLVEQLRQLGLLE